MVGGAGPGDWATPGGATAQGSAVGTEGAIDGEGTTGPGDWATPGRTAGPGSAATPVASMLRGASATLGVAAICGASIAVGTSATLGGGVTALAAEVTTTDLVVGSVPVPLASWTLLSAPFWTLGLGAAGIIFSAAVVARVDVFPWALFIVSALTEAGGLNPGPRSIVNPAFSPPLALAPVPTEARFLDLAGLFFWSFPLVYL